jgi:hypothetical protein
VAAEIDTARESISPEGDVRGRLWVSLPLSFGATHLAHLGRIREPPSEALGPCRL